MKPATHRHLEANALIADRTTFEGGRGLSAEIDQLFRQDTQVVVSMTGINNVSSSFLHGAFGVLIDKFGKQFVKDNIRFVGLSKFVKQQLLDYFNTYQPHRSGPSSPSTTS